MRSQSRSGRCCAHGLVVTGLLVSAAGCADTRLSFEQTGPRGAKTFLLTARQCTWANTPDGGSCLALTYEWETHAGQFILEGVRSKYFRIVIFLPQPIHGMGGGGVFETKPGMLRAYDDYTERGMVFTGGPGRVTVRCDDKNVVAGSFEVTCRGFLPGRGEKSLFSDDYVLRARFEAKPSAELTARMVEEVGWFFATPKWPWEKVRPPRRRDQPEEKAPPTSP